MIIRWKIRSVCRSIGSVDKLFSKDWTEMVFLFRKYARMFQKKFVQMLLGSLVKLLKKKCVITLKTPQIKLSNFHHHIFTIIFSSSPSRCSLEMNEECMTIAEVTYKETITMKFTMVEKQACTTMTESVSLLIFSFKT